MSMYNDCYVDIVFSQQFPHGVNNDEWRTKDGRVLNIKDMSSDHIRNCMRMIGEDDDFYYAFEAELRKRNTNV